jgi:hypothetical protein
MHKIGDILKLTKLTLEHRPTKWGVCVSVSDTLVLFINSNDRSIYECVPLNSVPGRKFPYYNSFIGCHAAYEIFPHHISSIDGRISKDEAQLICEKVSASRRMTKSVKEKITSSLSKEFNL